MQQISHQPIHITNLEISYNKKQCINNFNTVIYNGNRIGIIGRNGSGKSSLLKAIANKLEPSDGKITGHDSITGYVPQLIDIDGLSGAERFNQSLTRALANNPNLLLLDEPSNHLDIKNRQSLFNMLKRYTGTLILITHDIQLLNLVDTLWHIENCQVSIFNGSYTEYMTECHNKLSNLTAQVARLNKEKANMHEQLMHEQIRAKHSRQMGEKHIKQRKWPTITSTAKAMRAETTAGKNKQFIEKNKQKTLAELNQIYIPEVLIPKFNLGANIQNNRLILNIEQGGCGYRDAIILQNINLSMNSQEKIVIHGANASGKSTLINAIINKPNIIKSGHWEIADSIGYLDQHYAQLDGNKSAVILIQDIVPRWSHAEIRDHLNSFLLRKNEEVNLLTKYLSGGEKVRLSLALIAAMVPKLLILDEVTNNIDLETKEHMIQVLNNYPGGFILICHDIDFINRLHIDNHYKIENKQFVLQSDNF